MPTRIHLPPCMTDVYSYLFPTIDFSKVLFYDGIPGLFDNGQGGITIASLNLSSDIKVYLKENSYLNGNPHPMGPCNQRIFLIIAHELVHVLQIQDSLGSGKIPGSWIFRYLTCYIGWFSFSAKYKNQYELEAFDFANGLAGRSNGRLRDCMDRNFGGQSSCECSIFPGYKYSTQDNITMVDVLKKNCPDLVKKHATAVAPWNCTTNPFAYIIAFILAAFAVFGLTGIGGAIGTGVGFVVGGIIGLILFGPLGAVIGAFLGAIIGGFIGWAISSIFESSYSNKLWFTLLDGSTWMIPDLVITKNDHTQSTDAPAAAFYNNYIYMAYKAASSTDIWYNFFDVITGKWLDADYIITRNGHSRTDSNPALAVYKDKMYIAYKSADDSSIWYNYFEGRDWLSADMKITQNNHTKTSTGPAIAAYNGLLYMVYKSASNDDIWYNTFDGTSWLSNDIKITQNGHTRTSASPSIAEYNNKLYLVYKSASDNSIWYNTFDGNEWLSADIKITVNGHTRTDTGPSLVVYKNLLYMIYKSATGKDVWYNTFDGSSWLSQDVKITQGGVIRTSKKPALAVHPMLDILFMMYRDSS